MPARVLGPFHAAARISADRALNDVASYGYYTFWLALAGQDAPYDGLHRTSARPLVLRRLPRLLGATSHADPGARPRRRSGW